MNRHSRKNRIAVQPQTTRIVVSETRISPTVLRRKFAPLSAVVGLIADAIASERARASAPASSPSTSVAAPTTSAGRNGAARKSNGHAKVLAPTMPSLRDTFFLYDDPHTPSHRNPNYRESDISDQGDRYTHVDERSWKRYRAKQWRDGNRWSARREVLALVAW